MSTPAVSAWFRTLKQLLGNGEQDDQNHQRSSPPSSSSSQHANVADQYPSASAGTTSSVSQTHKKPPPARDDTTAGVEDVASALQRLVASRPNRFQALSPEHHLAISKAFSAIHSARDDIAYSRVIDAQGEEAQLYLDVLRELSHLSGLSPGIKAEVVVMLSRLSQLSGLYPSCFLLKNAQIQDGYVTEGDFGVIRKGSIRNHVVCFKIARFYRNAEVAEMSKRFSKEAILWEQLSHKNILPFYGVHWLGDVRQVVCLVSPWLQNGNVVEFLKRKPNVNRPYLVSDTINGLEYLHSQNIVHGGLQGTNILITPSGHACLAGFGDSTITYPGFVPSELDVYRCQIPLRWQSPELWLDENDAQSSPASDMYAFGCVCYEIFTGDIPFSHLQHTCTAAYVVMKGGHPARPEGQGCVVSGLDDAMWDLLVACWVADPNQRPSAIEVSQQIPKRPAYHIGNVYDDIFSAEAFRSLDLTLDLPIATNFNTANLINDDSSVGEVEKPGQKVEHLAGQLGSRRQLSMDAISAQHSVSLHPFHRPRTASELQYLSEWTANFNSLEYLSEWNVNRRIVRIAAKVAQSRAERNSHRKRNPPMGLSETSGDDTFHAHAQTRLAHSNIFNPSRGIVERALERVAKAGSVAAGTEENVPFALHHIVASQPTRFRGLLQEHHLALSKALSATDFEKDDVAYKKVINAEGEEAQLYLDILRELSHSSSLSSKIQTEVVTALYRLSQRSGLYPSCLLLKNAQMDSGYPAAEGSFGEIRKGLIQNHVVCFKVVKIFRDSQIEKLLKVFSKEAILWEQLSHKNILPFYGVYRLEDVHRRICLVSPWLENGNMTEFLKCKPDANRRYLVSDIIDGLEYLHGQSIVHADLKGANILVTCSGHACLADFGLSTVTDPSFVQWKSIATRNGHGTVRWRAPELMNAEDLDDVRCTSASDMYAFGCVCYEIFTGDVPFAHLKSDWTVMTAVMNGKRPTRPQGRNCIDFGLDDAMWDLVEECWAADPKQRPSANGFSKNILKRPATDFGKSDGDMLSPQAFRDLVFKSEEALVNS